MLVVWLFDVHSSSSCVFEFQKRLVKRKCIIYMVFIDENFSTCQAHTLTLMPRDLPALGYQSKIKINLGKFNSYSTCGDENKNPDLLASEEYLP